ncbi:MAG: hypothetical protein WED15_07105, partial [Akkermansiaceae bacterium]
APALEEIRMLLGLGGRQRENHELLKPRAPPDALRASSGAHLFVNASRAQIEKARSVRAKPPPIPTNYLG